MKTWEVDAAVQFLRDFADDLGNRGCNDFDLKAMIPDEIERRDFVRECREWNGDPEEFDPNFLELPDFAVVGFLAHKLEQINNEVKEVMDKVGKPSG